CARWDSPYCYFDVW
nr:immunoglobulin heavy chain junction region [Mus musculus]MBK4198278.1 immunoglobulin heavy chain junction region [Mus musculus]